MARYSHFKHTDPGQWRRKFGPEHHERIVRMKDERGLTWGAIAHWYTRNGLPVSYQAVRETYRRVKG